MHKELQEHLMSSDARSEASDASEQSQQDRRLSIDILGLLKTDHRFEEEVRDTITFALRPLNPIGVLSSN